jgi:hypothetical protein
VIPPLRQPAVFAIDQRKNRVHKPCPFAPVDGGANHFQIRRCQSNAAMGCIDFRSGLPAVYSSANPFQFVKFVRAGDDSYRVPFTQADRDHLGRWTPNNSANASLVILTGGTPR